MSGTVSLPTWDVLTCLLRNVPPSLQPTWGSRALLSREAGSVRTRMRSLVVCALRGGARGRQAWRVGGARPLKV